MSYKTNSESVFDRQFGRKHAYIYEFAAIWGQRSRKQQETRIITKQYNKKQEI